MSSMDLEELRACATPLVVYIGRALTRAAGLPSQPELARMLLDALPAESSDRRRQEIAALVERGALGDAFTEFERDLSSARLGLEIERALGDEPLEPPALGQMIAALGSRVHGVITPNLDRLLERAFGATLITHVRPDMRMAQHGGWLLKVNGTLHDRSSWVLTREQRARVSWREPHYARVLEGLLMARHMLFVGVSFEDSLFASLIDELRALSDGSPPRHWALVPRAQLDGPSRIKLDEAGIASIAYDADEELLELLRSLAPDPGLAPKIEAKPRRARAHGRLRILFVSATPQTEERVAVDREQRIIRRSLERAKLRERIEFTTRVAASFADLCKVLLEEEVDLVHIASHGEAIGTILDRGGFRMPVPPEQLMGLFDEYAPPEGRLACVVLNSCWSRAAADLASRVPTRIAMTGAVDDQAALAFSEGFYDAIGSGHDFAKAYREGRRRAAVAAPGAPFDVGLFEGSAD